MISIIVCSRSERMAADLSSNVKETIGAPYELVIVDNSENKYDIFSAYNYGVSQAKGDVMLFAHENIVVHSRGWGAALEKHMAADPEIGMVGVVGTQAVPRAPKGWNVCAIQGSNYKPAAKRIEKTGDFADSYEGLSGFRMFYSNPEQCDISQVLVVDGLMFAIRRELFDKGLIRFDDETFSGFHVYDVDISLQVAQHKKVMVLLDIELTHFSAGNRNRGYYESYFAFYLKWKDRLPMSIYPLSDHAIFDQHNALSYFKNMVKSGFFTDAEMRSYVGQYLRTIADERKTRFYYDILYYSNFYHKFGLRRSGVLLYHIFRKMAYGREK